MFSISIICLSCEHAITFFFYATMRSISAVQRVHFENTAINITDKSILYQLKSIAMKNNCTASFEKRDYASISTSKSVTYSLKMRRMIRKLQNRFFSQ